MENGQMSNTDTGTAAKPDPSEFQKIIADLKSIRSRIAALFENSSHPAISNAKAKVDSALNALQDHPAAVSTDKPQANAADPAKPAA
jgi:hypothetical protein